MRGLKTTMLLAALVGGVMSTNEAKLGSWFEDAPQGQSHHSQKEKSFQRIATFGNYLNNGPDAADETVSEIIAATANGRTLVYTDAIRGTIGFIDISNPSNPQPLGTLPLDPDPDDDMDHSPTSVDVLGNRYALVGVDTTSGDSANPSGYVLVVDISNPAAPVSVVTIVLHGQPDSLKISHDQRFAAIAIENQRNEDLCVGGTEDGTEADEDECEAGGGALGVLPQAPAGFLAVSRLSRPPTSWAPENVSLTGFALYAPEDPEPEYVDINKRNQAVVSLQENNHIVIVDLETLTVTNDFPAGAVTLNGVDDEEDGVISLTSTLTLLETCSLRSACRMRSFSAVRQPSARCRGGLSDQASRV